MGVSGSVGPLGLGESSETCCVAVAHARWAVIQATSRLASQGHLAGEGAVGHAQ